MLGVLVLAALSACSGGEAAFDEAGYQAFLGEAVNETPASPLIAAIGITSSTSDDFAILTMERIEQSLNDCMDAAGERYEAHVTPDDVGVAWLPAQPRGEFAAEHGFGSRLTPTIARPDSGIVDSDPLADYLNALPSDELARWDTALSDCRAAVSSVWGPEVAAIDPLFDQASLIASADTRVRDAADNYRQCTADLGLSWLNNPWIADLLGPEYVSTTSMSEEDEHKAAVAELRCRYEAESVRRAVVSEVEAKLVDDNAELLSRARLAIESGSDV